MLTRFGCTIVAMLAIIAPFAAGAGSTSGEERAQKQQGRRRIERMKKEVKKDIEGSRERLSALNEKIARKRRKLVGQIESLREEIGELEEEVAEKKKANEEAENEIENLKSETSQWRDRIEFINSLVQQHRRRFSSRLSAAQEQLYGEMLRGIDAAMEAEESTDRLRALPVLLGAIQRRIRNCADGNVFEGRALNQNGRVLKGQFVQIGPACYFCGDKDAIGPAYQRLGSVLPTVYDDVLSSEDQSSIGRLARTGSARVPVDVTNGSALEMSQTEGTLVAHLKKGGLTMIPLLGLALICGLVGVYKFAVLHVKGTRGAEEKVEEILEALHAGEVDEAHQVAADVRRPLGPVLLEGVKHHDAPKEHVEEIMYERLLSQIPALEKYLAVLAVGASAAPLLGLLGTVTGMIHTFKLITIFGTGEASNLSSGISEALVTTEVGLIIAVPALLVHAYLSRRVKKTISSVQQAAIMFVNGLKLKNRGDG